jgi:hypothetical protein
VQLVVVADGDLHFTRLHSGGQLHLRGVLEGEEVTLLVVDDEGRFDGDASVAAKALDVTGGKMPPPTPGLAASFFGEP